MLVLLAALAGCGQANQPAPGDNANGSPEGPKGKNEAQVKGKPTSYWIAQLRDKDPKTRIEAAEALQQIGGDGKEAVPELKIALKERVWEIFVDGTAANAENTFRIVGTTVGSPSPNSDKDEQIAQLQRQVKAKEEEIQRLRQQDERFAQDECLMGLFHALERIDPVELDRMGPDKSSTARRAQNTFQKVGDQIIGTDPQQK
jgi:hypothetical protein